MSENKEQEQEQQQPTRQVAAKKKRTRRVPRLKISAIPTLTIVAILIAVVASAITFYLWQQHRIAEQDRQALATSIERLLQVVEEKERTQQSSIGQLNQRHQELKRELKQQMVMLEKRVPDISQQLLSHQRDWNLAEVDYLLRLAGHRLQLSHDVPSAITALTLSRDLLATHGGAKFSAVVAMIGENIDKLEEFNKNGPAQAVSRLSALIAALDSLPFVATGEKLIGEGTETQSAGKEPTLSERVSYWGQKIWADLKSLVVIRHRSDIGQPLTTQNQRFFIQAQLQLKLEAARLSAMANNQVLFVANLEEADKLLRRYFDSEDSAVSAASATLKELSTHTVEPQLPPLQLIREQLYQRVRGEAEGASAKPQVKPAPPKAAATAQPAEGGSEVPATESQP